MATPASTDHVPPPAAGVVIPRPLPGAVPVAVLAACLVPLLLLPLGINVDFRPASVDFTGMDAEEILGLLPDLHRGAYIHTLLEWSAVMIACLTAAFALLSFRLASSVVAPLLGVALLCAGAMDAVHILAADGLLVGSTPSTDYVPLTWAVSRLFNAGILVAGAGLILLAPRDARRGRFVLVSGAVFCLSAVLIQYFLARMPVLPATQFPDALVSRPWDVAPLGLYLLAGGLLYRLNRVEGTVFSQTLLLSIIPHVGAQLWMAFGSAEVFDAAFNVGHALKVVAYLVPLLGLMVDHVRMYEAERTTVDTLDRARSELSLRTAALERSNQELQRFVSVASHDLREPLRKAHAFADLAVARMGAGIDPKAEDYLRRMVSGIERMQQLITDLVDFSRLNRSEEGHVNTDLRHLVAEVVEDLGLAVAEVGASVSVGRLPAARVRASQVRRLFQNLIANSLKFRREDVPPHVRITGRTLEAGPGGAEGRWVEIQVEDNGIGFDNANAERIFGMFQRLHGRTEYPGTGIGLAVCRRIVEFHGGRLTASGIPGSGARFTLCLPAATPAPSGSTPPVADPSSRALAPLPL